MTIEIKTLYGKDYKVVNGTCYDARTPDEIVRVLENARINGQRVRLWFGDTTTGKDWMEVYDVMGTIGRSTGNVKLPLLIKNSRSMGGCAILDHCIVKITINKQIVYKNKNYYLPTMEIKEANAELKAKGYNYSVFADGENTFNCKTYEKAQNEIDFHKGLRNKVA